jgi:putative NADPH-quinone reductase
VWVDALIVQSVRRPSWEVRNLAGDRWWLEELFAACGIKGPIDDLLFPINHGIFYSPDYDVLSPCVVYSADRLDDAGLEPVARTA